MSLLSGIQVVQIWVVCNKLFSQEVSTCKHIQITWSMNVPCCLGLAPFQWVPDRETGTRGSSPLQGLLETQPSPPEQQLLLYY